MKMECQMDRWTGTVSAVKQALYETVVVKRKLSWKAKLSIYHSMLQSLPMVLSWGVMNERMRLNTSD